MLLSQLVELLHSILPHLLYFFFRFIILNESHQLFYFQNHATGMTGDALVEVKIHLTLSLIKA